MTIVREGEDYSSVRCKDRKTKTDRTRERERERGRESDRQTDREERE